MTAHTTGRMGPIFNQPAGFTLNVDNPRRVAFTADKQARTIKGLALPFGDVAETGGRKYRFTKGVLKWAKVRLLAGHDWSQLLGTATFEETDSGLMMSATVANTRAGDDALALADSGALDGLSIGLSEQLRTRLGKDGVHDVLEGTALEVSLTPMPAFQNAQVQSVALQRQPAPAPADPPEAPTFDLGADPRFAGLAAQVNQIGAQVDFIANLPHTTPAGRVEAVREESMYRFAGDTRAPSGFDFAEDMLNASLNRDRAALARVQKFTAEQFGPESGPNARGPELGPNFVDTADVAALAPDAYRPELFLGDAPVPKSPMYDFFFKGGIPNGGGNQPFFWSALDRGNTTAGVADHVEGTDPTPGNVVTVPEDTVTPVAVSAKVHITREVGDRPGNPAASALVWARFARSYRIALETKTNAILTAFGAAAAALTAAIAAGATGNEAGDAIETGLVGLQFDDYGDQIVKGFGHVDLYTALAAATVPQFSGDTQGAKRYPIINPQNRSGISGDKFAFLEIAGYRISPAKSLGATSAAASNSWFAGPDAVHVWNTGLMQFDKLTETVEGWDLGCFGYFAGSGYDINLLRKVSYDPTV